MSSESKPIRGAWYLAPVALALIGWIAGVVVMSGAWDQVREARITSANQPLRAQGSSVAVFTDVLQADLAISCSWRAGGAAHRMPPATFPLTVDDDGMNWQMIAFEPEGRDGMEVRCRPTRGRTDNAQYAYAVVDGFTQRVHAGTAVSLGTLAVAIVGAIAIAVMRRRR
jgi:hypothetical protein